MSTKVTRYKRIRHPYKENKCSILFFNDAGDRGQIIGGGLHHILDKNSKELHYPSIFGCEEALRYIAHLEKVRGIKHDQA